MAPVNKHKHGDLFSGRVREGIVGSKAALGQAQRQRVELSAPKTGVPLLFHFTTMAFFPLTVDVLCVAEQTESRP